MRRVLAETGVEERTVAVVVEAGTDAATTAATVEAAIKNELALYEPMRRVIATPQPVIRPLKHDNPRTTDHYAYETPTLRHQRAL